MYSFCFNDSFFLIVIINQLLQLDYQRAVLEGEEKQNMAKLEKCLGTASYLETLRKQQYSGENPDPCPICKTTLQEHWSILPCGHCYCLECIETLLNNVSFIILIKLFLFVLFTCHLYWGTYLHVGSRRLHFVPNLQTKRKNRRNIVCKSWWQMWRTGRYENKRQLFHQNRSRNKTSPNAQKWRPRC